MLLSEHTVTARKAEIPEHLRQGELYRTLIENNDDPNEEVTFPADVFKLDTAVKSVVDGDNLLNSVRFWGVSEFVSKELIALSLSGDDSGIKELVQKYESEFRFVACLRQLLLSVPSEKINIAIKSGIIEIVQALAESGLQIPDDACDLAAEVGNLEVFVYLVQHGCVWNDSTCKVAARHGHSCILKFLIDNGCKAGADHLFEAIRAGHLECVKSDCFQHPVHYNIPRSGHFCGDAARYGQLSILQYLHDVGYAWTKYTAVEAANNGHLHCLQYLHENGCPWDVRYMCEGAAKHGHLSCLQYAHEQGCVLDSFTANAAAAVGHLDCLQYAHAHGCTWTWHISRKEGYLYCVRYDQNASSAVPEHYLKRSHACWAYLRMHATNTPLS